MFNNLKISKSKQINNIVVYFLKSHSQRRKNYLNLSKGLNDNSIGINELEGTGYRDLLKVNNTSNENLLLVNGEQIIGHQVKQNRVVASTSLVQSKSEAIVYVSCGEKNRWSPSTNQEVKTTDTIFFSRNTLGDQNLLWSQIDKQLDFYGIKSFTKDAAQVYDKNKLIVDKIVEELKTDKDTIGIALGNHFGITSLDLFSDPIIFQLYFKKILRGYVLANLNNNKKPINTSDRDVTNFINYIYEAKRKKLTNFKGQLGQKYSLKSKKIVGNILYDNSTVVHCSALMKNDLNEFPERNKTRKAA